MKTWQTRWRDMNGWASIPNRGFSCKAKDGKAEILIYEQIGESWWDGSGVGAKRFAEDLKALGDISAIDIRINSPGGDVTEADAIYTQLVQHPANVSVFVDGLAASAASFIAMAGDTIAIAENGKFMIHNSMAIGIDNAAGFRKLADTLDVFDSAIRTIYQRRTKIPEAKLKDWMEAETWFSGQQALDEGFADSLMKAKEPKEAASAGKVVAIDYLREKISLSKRIA